MIESPIQNLYLKKIIKFLFLTQNAQLLCKNEYFLLKMHNIFKIMCIFVLSFAFIMLKLVEVD